MKHSFPGEFATGIGKFKNLFTEHNMNVFKEFFGEELFPGSLNIAVDLSNHGTTHKALKEQLDNDIFKPIFVEPDFVIPKARLDETNEKGDAQIWQCQLISKKHQELSKVKTWILRRKGSALFVTRKSLEIVSPIKLRETFNLQDGELVTIKLGGGGGS